MKCTTVLHGGVCHRTSTPHNHKSGNKMKRKKTGYQGLILGKVSGNPDGLPR